MKVNTKCLSVFALVLMFSIHPNAEEVIDCDFLGRQVHIDADEDRRLRKEMLGDGLGAEQVAHWKQVKERDVVHAERLGQYLAACSWPSGERESHDAWLIAQHADHDQRFQETALKRLIEAVRLGHASAKDMAYLSDRVSVAKGELQKFGTQFTSPDSCTLVLLPAVDRAEIERNRAEFNMEKFESYEKRAMASISADCKQ